MDTPFWTPSLNQGHAACKDSPSPQGTGSPELTLFHVNISNAIKVRSQEDKGYFCDAGQLAGFQGAAAPGASRRRYRKEEGGMSPGGRTAQQRCSDLWQRGTFRRNGNVTRRRGKVPPRRGTSGKRHRGAETFKHGER